MDGVLGAALALLLVAQQSAPTIALMIDGQVQIVTMAEAERFAKSDDLRFRAAAEIALGTRYAEPEPINLEPHDLFRERFQRQPAQKPIPDQ